MKGLREQNASYPLPWVLVPRTNALVKVTLNLAGKPSPVFDTITVSTDRGGKLLIMWARAEAVEASATGITNPPTKD